MTGFYAVVHNFLQVVGQNAFQTDFEAIDHAGLHSGINLVKGRHRGVCTQGVKEVDEAGHVGHAHGELGEIAGGTHLFGGVDVAGAAVDHAQGTDALLLQKALLDLQTDVAVPECFCVFGTKNGEGDVIENELGLKIFHGGGADISDFNGAQYHAFNKVTLGAQLTGGVNLHNHGQLWSPL